MITYGCLNISPLLVDYGCLINFPSISQTYDCNYLKQISCMEKAIAQQSSVSASDANTIAIILTLLSAQSILAQMLLNTVHHTIFLSGEKAQVFYRMPTNIKFNLQIRWHYLNWYSTNTDNNLSTIWVNYIKHLKHLQIYLNLRAIFNSYPKINYGIPVAPKFPFRNAYYNASSNYSSQFQVDASQK